ncbi:hypothetical protein ACFOWZ_06695 [Lentzea rhizosphaerae]|uniref:Uncharacterized protein n=1 Tax=Lentzea rhizosphaerae TaxID=2041025 RepID=A0ABV8BLR9_9PSEU
MPSHPTPHMTWPCTGLSPTDVVTVAEAFERDGVFDVGERVTDFPACHAPYRPGF